MKSENDIPGKNPFKVPESYFEEVAKKIISSTVDNQNAARGKSSFIKLHPVLAIAASVAVFVMLGYTALKIFPPDNKEWLKEISYEELTESYLDDIDILILTEKTYPVILYNNMPDVSKTEIIDYLLLENIDSNEIYELL
jgi:hypothetical protein